ncbi:MAG: HIT domain-containing protein [Actinobacteria bacterium]|nr:HIT domain-containing protein [Actinomycetota bacterium]MSW22635.1 HIT domain-containing protein [Actinomycetota bacterium]MSX03321.1 HIT domain-containing protein [Actinomycetota bacterium]MSX60960.1 HIT domain-containing protein [Actinomycetota bacterium]MSX84463.1 HIT domain-containing protein [Actinomycetota bacterium]
MSCLFCKMASGEIPVAFVSKSESVFAINDISPQAPVHVLIIPKSHHENAAELSAADSVVLAEMHATAAKIAAELGLDGYRSVFNTGASAGQSVFHAHLHLLGGRQFAWPPG